MPCKSCEERRAAAIDAMRRFAQKVRTIMDENGKVSSADITIYPAHWTDTPTTPVSQAYVPLGAAEGAVKLGKSPPGFKPPPGSPYSPGS